MSYVLNTLTNLLDQTAFMNLTVGNYVMIAVACVFLYLAIKHGFEPLLLVPIAFGMLLVNIYRISWQSRMGMQPESSMQVDCFIISI